MSTPNPPPTTADGTYTDPTATQVALSSLDFLLIEMVPMAYRITNDLAMREEEWTGGAGKPRASEDGASTVTGTGTGAGGASSSIGGATGGGSTLGGGSSLGVGTGGGTATGTGMSTLTIDEEEAREAVFHRLENLGYRVGLGVVERFSRTSPRPTTPLDAIKFLCKDLWTLLFRKQIDNLKTNHRGIYVLTDNHFKPLTRMSFDTRKFPNAINHTDGTVGDNSNNGLGRVQPFLYFPAGLIRGCLAGLGIQASVTAECVGLPGATFQIRTVGAKA